MIEIISYEQNQKEGSTLIGFFTVHIKEWDLTISRMCEFSKDDRNWITMPSYSLRDPDEADKWLFYPVVKFGTERHEKFLTACKKSLNEFKQKPINQGNNEEQELLPF